MHGTNLRPTEPYPDIQDLGGVCQITLLDPQFIHPSLATKSLAV